MGESIVHAKNSVAKYGGIPGDYLPIHEFINSGKTLLGDVRHRALFHHSFGCLIVETVFGSKKINSSNKTYSPVDVAEDHIKEDLGCIPTIQDYFDNLIIERWMLGGKKEEVPSGGNAIRLTNGFYNLFQQELLNKLQSSGINGFRWSQYCTLYLDHLRLFINYPNETTCEYELFAFQYLDLFNEWQVSDNDKTRYIYDYLFENFMALLSLGLLIRIFF
jgi:hypothetical protein